MPNESEREPTRQPATTAPTGTESPVTASPVTAAWVPLLEQFVVTARLQHIGAAARQLGLHQPTLTRNLARLSNSLGAPLLQRRGRGVELTRYGRQLLPQAEASLDALAQGFRDVAAAVDPKRGEVALAFLHSFGPRVVPALLRRFAEIRPRIRVSLSQGPAATVAAAVLAGQADLCLLAPAPAQPGLASQLLGHQPLRLLISADHPWARRRKIAVAELAGQPLITMDPATGLRGITDALLAEAGVEPRVAFESEEIATTAGLVSAGLGIAVVPEGTTLPGTRELPLVDPEPRRGVAVAWASGAQHPAPVRALRELLLTEGPSLSGSSG